MLIIRNVLVSEEILENNFVCNLNACKGACCWEGDYGAPLEKIELEILEKIYPIVQPYLTPAGRQAIEEQGLFSYSRELKEFGTTLVDNAACAFMTLNEQGIAQCGIEQAWRDQKIDFQKPVSCHLYPIRIQENHHNGFEVMHYDEWDICSAACTLGDKAQVPVYQFVKDGIIRKYGQAFFEELDAAAQHLKS